MEQPRKTRKGTSGSIGRGAAKLGGDPGNAQCLEGYYSEAWRSSDSLNVAGDERIVDHCEARHVRCRKVPESGCGSLCRVILTEDASPGGCYGSASWLQPAVYADRC